MLDVLGLWMAMAMNWMDNQGLRGGFDALVDDYAIGGHESEKLPSTEKEDYLHLIKDSVEAVRGLLPPALREIDAPPDATDVSNEARIIERKESSGVWESSELSTSPLWAAARLMLETLTEHLV